jgi:hypothetical protein
MLLFFVGTDYKVYGAGRWFNAVRGDVDDEHPPYGIGGVDDEAYRAMEENRQFRVVTDETAGPDPAQYRFWRLATPQGFDPFLSVRYKHRIKRWVPFQTNRLFYADLQNEDMLQTLGVRYVLVRRGAAHDPLLAVSPNFRRIGREDVFCHVYEYLHARPPYRLEGEGSVQVTGWIPERREFRVRSEHAGRFVLVEQFFPGWQATVDGRPVGIELWDGTFQALSLPAGEHEVRFRFRG